MIFVFNGAIYGTSRLGHQLTQNDGGGLVPGAAAGFELQGTHGAVAHVGQPVQRRDFRRGNAFVGHVAVDQGVAKVVGQRVAEHGGQALVGVYGQVGEQEDGTSGGWHVQRCGFQPRDPKLGRVAEDVKPVGGVQSDGTDALAPQVHINDVHVFVAGGPGFSDHRCGS